MKNNTLNISPQRHQQICHRVVLCCKYLLFLEFRVFFLIKTWFNLYFVELQLLYVSFDRILYIE